jgi:hypothetical protein
MARDLEVDFERMLVNRPMYTARRTVGVRCPKMRDDEDSPWFPPVQASDIGGGSNAPVEVVVSDLWGKFKAGEGLPKTSPPGA